ncbi:GNAT family N-acetyltransferase [Streptomyces sp. MMS24-I29]|uniref:GNAT family N-acetyltransferase n=1 Tax=Streptomyces sp. MMS24-I29 TaxID=3351480 RepID=UPI003C7A3C4A
MTAPDATHPLDRPVHAALTGPHASFAERRGRVLRYPADVAAWCALPQAPEAEDWADAAALAGPGGVVSLMAFREPPPEDWEVVFHAEGVQLVDAGVEAAPFPEAVRLGPADVPEMLDLVARTRPGPFLPRTVELGSYLGVRRDGVLVAMAGERLRPPGWSEISGVCTDESVRGQGLGGRLVRAVAHEIARRGETPFLHAAASNTGAVRLYESLGFVLRRRTSFLAALVPGHPPTRLPDPDGARAGGGRGAVRARSSTPSAAIWRTSPRASAATTSPCSR